MGEEGKNSTCGAGEGGMVSICLRRHAGRGP
jgi:hypothetical protein